ncbi:MAG: threonine/serine exporter family protein [Lachnospiraceae bacterium]
MKFYLIQIVMGMLGSVGFAVLFGICDRTLAAIALGSGMGWIVYLFCMGYGYGMFAGLLSASLFVAVLSEILARKFKTPVILLLVPMLIPEIPGGDLYYTMYYLVQGRYPEFGKSSNLVLAEAGAIVLGIILASYIVKFTALCKTIVDKSGGNV